MTRDIGYAREFFFGDTCLTLWQPIAMGPLKQVLFLLFIIQQASLSPRSDRFGEPYAIAKSHAR